MRGVRRYAGGGARADGVHLPGLLHGAGAPAGAHAATAPAPPPRASHTAAVPRHGGRGPHEAAVRGLRGAAERAAWARTLRLPGLRRRARSRRCAATAVPPLHGRRAARARLAPARLPGPGGTARIS